MREVENKVIKDHDVHTVNAEGNADSRWVVLDYIDVMVHIMHGELRELYGLEDLWAEGKEIDWQGAK
jgi:ribosome-associated protein